jgi:hypothetical protein
MSDNEPTCGAEAAFDDGSPNLVCVREDDRHIRHTSADGTVFIRVGNGFMISELHR